MKVVSTGLERNVRTANRKRNEVKLFASVIEISMATDNIDALCGKCGWCHMTIKLEGWFTCCEYCSEGVSYNICRQLSWLRFSSVSTNLSGSVKVLAFIFIFSWYQPQWFC